jgi:microcystin degradation protein MlrC
VSRIRVGLVRIAQESNAFSPLPSEIIDFDRTHFFEGQELLAILEPGGIEVEGFLKDAELSGALKAIREHAKDTVEIVPMFSSWAMPGGPLSPAALAGLNNRLRDSLRAVGPLDGLVFSMHGAMVAEETDDPEALFMETVREECGTDTMVAVSLDLHGQMTKAFIDQIDILAAYRTNPHRDHAKTGYRAGAMLIRALMGQITPVLAWRTLPMVLGGGTTMDFRPTMRPVYKHLTRIERDDKVLDASVFNCHLWARHEDMGWSTIVMVDGDQALAESLADDIADRLWGVRHKQPPTFPDPAEALQQVRRSRLRRKFGTVCMCDASDIVGTGTVGENTRLLRALVEDGADLVSYVPIRDAQVIEQLANTVVGTTVSVELGGRLDPENPVFSVTGRLALRTVHDTFGRMVVLTHGNTSIVVTEHGCLVMKPQFYSDLGLSPWRADIVVVKSLFPFRLYFLMHNRRTIYVKTRGASDFDRVKELTFNAPVHPLHPVEHWRPEDARRRGVALR